MSVRKGGGGGRAHLDRRVTRVTLAKIVQREVIAQAVVERNEILAKNKNGDVSIRWQRSGGRTRLRRMVIN